MQQKNISSIISSTLASSRALDVQYRSALALRALTVRLTAPRGSGVPNEISADARDDEDEGEHDDAWDRAASHALASA